MKPNSQQQLKEMANYLVKSPSHFARNLAVTENIRLLNLLLLVVAKRYIPLYNETATKKRMILTDDIIESNDLLNLIITI